MYKSMFLSFMIFVTLTLSGCGGGSSTTDTTPTKQQPNTTTTSPTETKNSVVNQTPVATFDSFTIQKDARYDGQLTASDADGDTLKYVIVTQPKHGSVVLHDNGCFTYTPNDGYQGSDTFSYRASDDVSSCAVKTVTIDVCKPIIQKPTAPTNLTVKALSINSLELTWKDNSDNEEGFSIYKDGKLICTTKANKTKATINCGLKPATTYNFEVRAKNQAGTSDSASAQGTTKDVTIPPTAPSELTAKAVEKTSVRLEWKDNSDNESSFEIYQDGVKVKTISSGCSCTVITGLKEGTTYNFVVKAVNKIGSGASDGLSVRTLGGGTMIPKATKLLNNDVKIITDNNVSKIIKTDFNSSAKNSVIVSDSLAGELKQGEIFYLPGGIDKRYPLGIVGKIEDITPNQNQNTQLDLSPVGYADIFQESKQEAIKIPLTADNFIGVVATDNVLSGVNSTKSTKSIRSLHQTKKSFLNGGIRFIEE